MNRSVNDKKNKNKRDQRKATSERAKVTNA